MSHAVRASRNTERQGMRPRAGWRDDLALAGLVWSLSVAGLLAIFAGTAWSMLQVWSGSATYGHGFLIVPIAAFMAWRRRARLQALPLAPSGWGLALLAAASVLWLLGHLAHASLAQHLALVVMLQASVLAVFGRPMARLMAAPLAYLLLAVPFGDFAVPPLQDLTGEYTTRLLRLTGVPVYLENWRMVIPGGAFLVAEACAGVRYLLASLALGGLICDMMFRRAWKVVLFLALCLAVPVVANVIRAYGIVMLAHLSDFEIAVGVDHLIYGWGFLSFVTMILIALAMALRDPDAAPRTTPRTTPVQLAGTGGDAARSSRLRAMTVAAGVALLAVAGAAKGYGVVGTGAPGVAAPALEAPRVAGGWRLVPDARPRWRGTYPHADSQRTWVFTNGADRVAVFAAYYTHERAGAELVGFPNTPWPRETYEVYARGQAQDAAVAGLPPAAAIWLRADDGEARLVWHWYWVDGRYTDRATTAKLNALRARLFGRVGPAGVLALSSAAADEPARVMRDFLERASVRDVLHRATGAVRRDAGDGQGGE